jgi:hypothetical protein
MKSHEGDKLFLIDFGIAKQILDNERLENNTNLQTPRSTDFGTPGYKAPEDASSPASDLYSLGATCFHLLTGISPSYADERSWLNVEMEVKRETSAILKKLFEKEVSNRYQDAEKVLQDLREIKDIQRSKKIEFLLYLLNTTDDRYRRQAINDLAEFGSYAGVAVPQLISLLQEDDFQLYIPASYTLVKIGENSVPSLAELLKHEKLKIRRRAATTLEQIGVQAKAAIPQLIQALEDSDPDGNVPWYAVITIGKIGVPAQKAIPVLIKKLNDPQPEIRAWTLYALGKMGNLAREAESIIWEILSQENPNVFMVGIEALDSIGANIDQIQFNHIENNITITLREWVLLRREELKPQEAPTKAFMLEFEPKLNPWPSPLKDPHNFRNP